MHHHRDLQDFRDLLSELDGRNTPGAGNDMARPHLDADDMLAVFRVTLDDPVEIDIPYVAQFGNPVAGNQPDRAEI